MCPYYIAEPCAQHMYDQCLWENAKFIHFRKIKNTKNVYALKRIAIEKGKEYDHFGGITVAFYFSNNNNGGHNLVFTISKCSPKERFERAAGRIHAIMNAASYTVTVYVPEHVSIKNNHFKKISDIYPLLEWFFNISILR